MLLGGFNDEINNASKACDTSELKVNVSFSVLLFQISLSWELHFALQIIREEGRFGRMSWFVNHYAILKVSMFLKISQEWERLYLESPALTIALCYISLSPWRGTICC